MVQTAIAASVRYLSDGSTCAWPVPFPFGSQADLGVAITKDGVEAVLAHGSGYILQNGCVMAVVPAGSAISIWLKTDADSAMAGARAKAAMPPASLAAMSLEPAEEESADETVSQAIDRITRHANEIMAMLTQTLHGEADKLQAQLRLALETAQNEAVGKVRNCGQDQRNSLMSEGRSKLDAMHGIEREAMASLDQRSREYCAIMQGNADEVAGQVLEAKATGQAIESRAGALQALSQNIEARASVCRLDAEIAKDRAKSAWQAAWQASVMANRPGVSTIGKMSELDKCASGMFVINGRVEHAPTMFFGLWPVSCPCRAAWDGFFVIAEAFPEDPVMPPYPVPADPDVSSGTVSPGDGASVGVGEWGPCIHHNFAGGEDEPELPVCSRQGM